MINGRDNFLKFPNIVGLDTFVSSGHRLQGCDVLSEEAIQKGKPDVLNSAEVWKETYIIRLHIVTKP